jgi:geranylgeranyl diphosphate synthase, type II
MTAVAAKSRSARTARLVTSLLRDYGSITRARLKEYLTINVRGEASYLYDLVNDYPARGGSAMRPTICLATARAFGAPVADAINSAVSLEIMHNAFLVHDDIEDASEERRGNPTLHRLHGVPIAVNVGDAMAILSLRPLIDNRAFLGGRLALRIFGETEKMARETVEGQAIELKWRRDVPGDLGVVEYLQMVLKKTCWYSTIFPLRVGAIIGGSSEATLEALTRFGFFLGAAFQITDDVLNLVGQQQRYGKEIAGDLWEGKRTLVTEYTLGSATPAERQRLQAFLTRARDRKRASEVRYVRSLIYKYDAIAYASRIAHGLAGAALHEFHVAFRDVPKGRDRDFLAALPEWVIHRAA